MASSESQRALVVVQLSGGNDALNTVIPYTNGLYYENRPQVHIPQEDVLPIDEHLGFHPSMGSIKQLWDEGKVAVINGIGYPKPNRSHFRSLDVWHTAESEQIGQEGWLGKVIRDLDPKGENVLTGVNFGRGLLRSLYAKGVPVASVGNLETYGLFPDIKDEGMRQMALQAFSQMYGGEGKDMMAQYISQMGTDALKGADVLRVAPRRYTSSVTYADTPIAQNLKSIAQVLCADLGTRVYHTVHQSFDTHASELTSHAKLWTDVSAAIGSFMADLQEHGKDEDVVILMFSEFGRRIRDNGAGTDHGSGGVAFVLGTPVQGGLYGEFPSLRDEDQLEGDLHFNNDFRSTYATLVDRWLGLDPVSITNGVYEQFDFI
jgi:uncharacterized protein (DUF1501 family)